MVNTENKNRLLLAAIKNNFSMVLYIHFSTFSLAIEKKHIIFLPFVFDIKKKSIFDIRYFPIIGF